MPLCSQEIQGFSRVSSGGIEQGRGSLEGGVLGYLITGFLVNYVMTLASKQKVTFNLPSELVRAYRLSAVRQGLADQELIEQALREFLGLTALERLQGAFAHLELTEDAADRLAVEAVREVRRERASGSQAGGARAVESRAVKPRARK